MATLLSSPFSMRLNYYVYNYSFGNEFTDWHINYHAVPLLYDRPYIRPKFLHRLKQPPAVFDFTDCSRNCTFLHWLKNALNGNAKSWLSIEPPYAQISLFPGNKAPYEAQGIFLVNDIFNPDGVGKPMPDEYLLLWQFEAGFFKLKPRDKDCAAPFVIQQWVRRRQLEVFIQNLEEELANALKAAGVELR